MRQPSYDLVKKVPADGTTCSHATLERCWPITRCSTTCPHVHMLYRQYSPSCASD